ncbi:trypsin-like serine peptidase [Streptomyces kebangsaanensis]|uniref:trypsin-like serine peptidase n=1 Tax=Streptomyces kebangsaanensis TaxID=864058 RepID=UPI0009397160|nr:trypsin-like peptidase domain-containing protein [Streptomyces kebangsaanensis]
MTESGDASTPPGQPLKATPEEIAEAKAAEAYWTPERIAAAVPVDPGKGADGDNDGTPKDAPTLGKLTGASSFDNRGVATAGVFLINNDDDPQSDPGKRDQFCSASSVASPTKSLIITAAHCLNDNDRFRSLAFAPGWKPDPDHRGRGIAPYGIFPIKKGKVWIDGRYLAQGPAKADDLDFAFLRSGPNSKGQFLENATGMGNELTTLHSSQLAQRNVTLIGFPGGAKAPLVCPSTSTKGFEGRFLEIACDGFAPGVSGGPFLRDFDGKRGDIIGVIGGYKTGGTKDDVSYSSQFDADVVRLYNQAVNDYAPDSPRGIDGMGDAKLWRHALAAASGSFHTASQKYGDSDLIVRWSDGEVTLYPGDQNQGFYTGCKAGQPCEVQLAKPNDMWGKYADVITAGDYTGSNAYDLLVKWVDGEVTIYKDIDQNTKLPTSTNQHPANEIKIAPAGSVWKHAKGIATGKYGGNKWPDDLVVRWVDGEVTKYLNVDSSGFHAETQLLAKNKLWAEHADLITGGDFDGTVSDTKPDYDLFVKWSDGELTIYQDIGTRGLKGESRLKAANSTWTHARVVAVGEFGANDWEDDLFVRWSDGEVTIYGNTQADALGREYMLVPPPSARSAVGVQRSDDPCAQVCGPELYRRSAR